MVSKILHGPMVPEWFKKVSDGCSTPRFLDFALRPEEHKVMCYVHDKEYYDIEVQFVPRTKDYKKARRRADHNLRKNMKECCLSKIYFVGVYLFGWVPLRRRWRKKVPLHRPPNRFAVGDLKKTLQHPLTLMAKETLHTWRIEMIKEGTW